MVYSSASSFIMIVWTILGSVLVFHTSTTSSASDFCGTTTTSMASGFLYSPTKNSKSDGGFRRTSTLTSLSEYPNNQDCTYKIRALYGALKLSWNRFDLAGYMPTCWPEDYVEIFVGCDSARSSIGKYCSSNSYLPFDVYSPDNCMEIKFHSDGSKSGKGFQAYYQVISNTKSRLLSTCGNVLHTGNRGIISSPNWPANYPAFGRSCYWAIQVGKSKSIKIAFMDFDLDKDSGCDDTKIKVKADDDHKTYSRADKTVVESRCGHYKAFSVTSSEERIYIRFKTGYRNTRYRGFVAGYVLYEPSIHDTGSKLVIGVVCAIVVIIIIGCMVFCYVRRRRAARQQAHGPVVAMATTAQSYPTEPPQPQSFQPPPPYGQATAGTYPPPGQQMPPPGSYPVQSEKQGPYPPTQGYYPPPGGQPYPPPGGQPYPPPGGQPYPPPGGQPYPPPGGQPYPPPGGQPYPPPGGQPYPPPGGQPYPPPGGQPYPPTDGQPYPPPGQEQFAPPGSAPPYPQGQPYPT